MVDKNVTDDFCLEYHAYFPSKYSQTLSPEIRKVAQSVTNKLTLDNCCFHLECKVHNNQIRVIEMAGRPGGGFINTYLIPKVRDLSLIEAYIKNALGEETSYPEFDEPTTYYAGMFSPLANQTGKIKSLPNINKLLEIEGVDYILPIKNIGSYVDLPPADFSPNLSFILATDGNYTHLVNKLERTASLYNKGVVYEK